jgi:hypothetical protein
MKNLIKKILKEYSEEQKILHIPSLIYFNNDWNTLQRFLQLKGNPLYSIGGRLDLFNTPIKSLGNLTSVGGYLDLRNTPIESLGNLTSVEGYLHLVNTPIESLGNLTSVEGYLHLNNTPIKSLGNLTSVGGYLDLRNTPISKKYTEEEVREMVNVEGDIYM